jgi:hypothetical protein
VNPRHTLFAAALLGALCLPAFAQSSPDGAVAVSKEPGKVTMSQVIRVTATVEAIDRQKREVTLKGPKGHLETLTVGPDVRNFDQVKVHDQVVVGYLEALSLTLNKGGKETVGMTESADGTRAAAGDRPAGVASRQIEVTADVIAVDTKNQVVTLRGPKQVVDLKVADPEQFKLVQVGDQVHAIYSQAVAVSVEPVAKK